MKKTILFVLAAVLLLPELKAQTQSPGLDVLGYGYDVFGEYADQKSKKRYCLFKYANFAPTPIGSEQYNVPKYVFLENISDHIVKTVSGESIRDYAQSLSAEVGLSGETMFFKGSMNASFATSTSGTEQNFYFTYMDANTKWRVSFDERDLPMLKTILEPRFKQDLNNPTVTPAKLFELYGTHYIASAYLGGRADFTSVSVITEQTNTTDIAVAVEASYKVVSANASLEKSKSETLRNAKTTTKLRVTGGNSQYANNISNQDTYNLWASGIEKMPILCDFDKNSLKPIWDFCDNPKRKAELEAEFEKMCKNNPLPKAMVNVLSFSNKNFFIKSKSTGTYWDMGGYHLYAQRKGGKVALFEKDVNAEGWQGADRFIKVIKHITKPEYVFFQPQHSHFVADISGGVKTAGAELQLWDKGDNNLAQMFKMIKVDGEDNTYYIQNANSNLFLTAKGNKKNITQEAETKGEEQKWVFEPANAETEMAPPVEAVYSMQNVKGKRFIDIPGSAPKQQGKGAHLQLWDMDNDPDRYFTLQATTDKQYFLLQAMHSNLVLDAVGGKADNGTRIQMWDRNNSQAQTFKFVYAGEPLTYYIVSRNNNKALDASDSRILENGCPLQLWDWNRGENQKWRLTMYDTWQIPTEGQGFYIKEAYTNKYWDIPGTGNETNANGKEVKIWDLDSGADRIYKIFPSGDHSWVNIQVQNGGRYVAIPSNSKDNRTPFIIHDKTNGNDQKFAIQFTSPTTFVLRTNNWKAADTEGGTNNINVNGTRIIQWDPHFEAGQQFQLIYADGPNKGKPFVFQPK